VLSLVPLLFFLVPSLVAAAVARRLAARALGMNGVGWFFNGSIENDVAAPFWRSSAVAVASVVTSYSVPAVLFALALLAGASAEYSTEVTVMPNGRAETAGMMTGDRVVSVGGTRVTTFAELAPQIAPRSEEPVEVVAMRGPDEMHFTVTPKGPPGKAMIGVKPKGTLPRGFLGSVARGFTEPVRVLAAVAKGVGQMLSGAPEVEMAGPVAIVRAGKEATASGVGPVLYLVAAMIAYVWPFAALTAIVTAPRRR
jgi:regulator of sigma E protease